MPASINSLVTLSLSVQSQPGVYAVLLGSGVSQSAGVATGWDIVKQLVHKVAALEGRPGQGNDFTADEDPESWWQERYDAPLGYSALLEQVAPTSATRQGILRAFFEPSEEEVTQGLKRPTAAHIAIARLVKRGFIKVIITTNFDRLMEAALVDEGVSAQVIASPGAVAGMTPLTHSSATLVKIHGDYLDIGSLNTEAELESYNELWKPLLRQIFDDYGLIISGWSAEWDKALVREIAEAPSRRYPLYWDGRSSGGIHAQQLLQNRSGNVVQAADADSFFTELLENITSLDNLLEAPVSTSLGVARVKRYVPDPLRRIDLSDLLFRQVDDIDASMSERLPVPGGAETFEEALMGIVGSSKPLLHMVLHGVYNDDGSHESLWVRLLQKLVDLRRPPSGTFWPATQGVSHLPAQMVFYLASVVAIAESRDGLLIRLSREPLWTAPFTQAKAEPAAFSLHLQNVLDGDLLKATNEWGGRWIWPQSHFLREVLTPVLIDIYPSHRVNDMLSDVEYRIAIMQHILRSEEQGLRRPQGVIIWVTGQGILPIKSCSLRIALDRRYSSVRCESRGKRMD
ncbi:NAD-dependent protein deacetylase sirtuin-4 [Clavibacter michiganensis subsp. michiganensis]|nr:NAD-dependent protein deacetylase sirtuin-4 [Clavibacter michiganensis subsp. michiganensis]